MPTPPAYVTKFAHRSLTTKDFQDFLYEYFSAPDKRALLDGVDWEAWYHGTGMPPVANTFDNTLARECEALAAAWNSARANPAATPFPKAAFDALTSGQKMMLLDKMLQQPVYDPAAMAHMAASYDMGSVGNCEVKFRWQWLALNARYTPILPDVVQFVTTMGRMKYVRPLYRAMLKSGEEGAALARRTFLAHRDFYHPICAAMVAKDLGV